MAEAQDRAKAEQLVPTRWRSVTFRDVVSEQTMDADLLRDDIAEALAAERSGREEELRTLYEQLTDEHHKKLQEFGDVCVKERGRAEQAERLVGAMQQLVSREPCLHYLSPQSDRGRCARWLPDNTAWCLSCRLRALLVSPHAAGPTQRGIGSSLNDD